MGVAACDGAFGSREAPRHCVIVNALRGHFRFQQRKFIQQPVLPLPKHPLHLEHALQLGRGAFCQLGDEGFEQVFRLGHQNLEQDFRLVHLTVDEPAETGRRRL